MAIAKRPAAAKAVKPKQVRYLDQTEEHLVKSSLTRRDGKANLFSVVTDLVSGKAVVVQETKPTTVDAQGVSDIIEFFTAVHDLLINAPTPVIVEDEAEATEGDAAA